MHSLQTVRSLSQCIADETSGQFPPLLAEQEPDPMHRATRSFTVHMPRLSSVLDIAFPSKALSGYYADLRSLAGGGGAPIRLRLYCLELLTAKRSSSLEQQALPYGEGLTYKYCSPGERGETL